MKRSIEAVRAHPVEVVGVVVGGCAIVGALAGLECEGIVALVGGKGNARTELEAVDIVPILRAEVDVDRCTVVLPATNHNHLLTCRECPILRGAECEVKPIGILSKLRDRVGTVEALTPRIGKLGGNLTIHTEVEVAYLEARSIG